MDDRKLGEPVFVNVTPAHPSGAGVGSRLDKLRALGKAAKEAVHSQVMEDRQRRSHLAESITDRAMRSSIRDLEEK